MFSYEEIQKFNETEILIYKFIISNIEKIPYMTIRELASDIHISTSTLLRFCNKNGFEGYSEFKKAINDEIHLLKTQPPLEDLQELNLFFQRTNSSAFERKLSSAIEIIKNSDYLIFIGNGSSGT
ncbi:MurR/RpiR family transcriptional regulator, partial [Enterocloster clostridioformis]